MIFDRTQEDVKKAMSLIESKVKQFRELTESEIEILEKGTLTINTLNRIEDKISEVKELINEIGYWNAKIYTNSWNYLETFTGTNFFILLSSISDLVKAFYVYSDTPSVPSASYHYSVFNALEKILYDLSSRIEDMRGRFRQCGTFQCGEANEN